MSDTEEKKAREPRAWRGPTASQVMSIATEVGFSRHFADPKKDPWGTARALTLDEIWSVLRPESGGRRSFLENRALSAYLRHMTSTGYRSGKLAFRVVPLAEPSDGAMGNVWQVDDPLTHELARVLEVLPSLPVRLWMSNTEVYALASGGRTLSQSEKRAIGAWLAMQGARQARRGGGRSRHWSVRLRVTEQDGA